MVEFHDRIRAARAAADPLGREVIDAFKDQLLLVLINRLAGKGGNLRIPVAEVDDTGRFVLSFRVDDGTFHFELRKKQ